MASIITPSVASSVAAVVPARHERDLVLQVFRVCAIGFDADTLALEEHDAIEKGWIHEIVGVVCANRAGDTISTQLPFRYAGRHLVWKDRQDIPTWASPR